MNLNQQNSSSSLPPPTDGEVRHSVDFSEIDIYINNRVAALRLDTDSEAESEDETVGAFTTRMLMRRYSNLLPVCLPSPTDSERYHLDMYEATQADAYDDDPGWEPEPIPLHRLTHDQVEGYFNIAFHNNHWYQSSDDGSLIELSISEYDSESVDSDATARTEEPNSDSDDEFWIPENVMLNQRLVQQSGRFILDDIDLRAQQEDNSEEYARAQSNREYLRNRVAQGATAMFTKMETMRHIPELPSFNDTIGNKMKELQTLGNLGIMTDFIFNAYRFIYKVRLDGSVTNLTGSLIEFYTGVTGNRLSSLAKLPPFMQEAFNIKDDMIVEQQAGSFSFGEMLSNYELFKNSAIVEKLTKLATVFAMLGVTTTLGMSMNDSIFSKVWKIVQPMFKEVDMFSQVCEAIHLIWTKCTKAFMSGDLAILSDGSKLQMLESRCAKMVMIAERHLTGNTLEDDMDLYAAVSESSDIEQSCYQLSKIGESLNNRRHFAAQYIKMSTIKTSLQRKLGERPIVAAAMVVTLWGDPGTGKSASVPVIVGILQHNMKMAYGPQHAYTVQSDDKYMTGYTDQNTIVLDDFANAEAQFADTNPCNTIIGLCNNNKKMAVKAAVDEKGKTLVVAQGIVVTLNKRDAQSKKYSTCPEAMLRRLGLNIEVKVKPEFCKPGTTMLRPGVDVVANCYDVWNATVTERNPTVGNYDILSDELGPLENVPMPRVYEYIGKAAIAHKANQNRLLRQIDEQNKQSFCSHGNYDNICLKCKAELELPPVKDEPLEVQAGAYESFNSYLTRKTSVSMIADQIHYKGIKVKTWSRLLLGLLLLGIAIDVCYTGKLGMSSSMMLVIIAVVAFKLRKEYDNMHNLMLQAGKFAHMADEVRDKFFGPKAQQIALAVAGVGMVAMVWKLYRSTEKDKLDAQGSMVSMPKIEVNTVSDHWNKPMVEKRLLEPVNPNSTGTQISALLATKMCLLRFFDDPADGEECLGIPLCSYTMMVPTHIVNKGRKTMRIIRGDSNTHNGHRDVLLDGAVWAIPETDFSLVYAPSICDQVDLRKFLPSLKKLRGGKLNLRHEACRIIYAKYEPTVDPDGHSYKKLVSFNKGVNVSSCRVEVKDMPPLEGAIYDFPEKTRGGLCGAVAVTEGPDCFIPGFHCAGITDMHSSRLNTIYLEQVMAVFNNMIGPDTAILQGAEQVPFNLDHKKMPFQELLPKLSSADFTEGEVAYLGSHEGKIRTIRSAVIPSPISEDITLETGVERIHGKPHYINHWSPQSNWINNCARPALFPQKFIDGAYNSLYNEKILPYLEANPHYKDLIHKIPDSVVINGVDGVKGYSALNFSASIGLFECRPKKEYLIPNEEEVPGITCNRTYREDVMKDYFDMEEQLKKGVRVYSPFRVNVKDEATKLTKAKVRIFSGGQNSLLMLLRKYFLSVSVFMQNHMGLFESAVGAACTGRDWDYLKELITKFGEDRIVAGDYSKFDQYVMNAITLASFKILIQICMWAGYDDEDLTVMEGLATEVCNPVYEMNGLWIMLGSSTASGHSLTVVINGLNNCIYMRMAFNGLKPIGCIDKFHECVSLITYGDDNVMSVREDCGWFNHTTIQSWLAQYGITYTMADKLEASKPYIHIDDATFLKRRWVYDIDMGLHRCPLEEESIFKMLHTVQLSKTETVEQQLGNIISTANREFFQYGYPRFEQMREMLMRVAIKHDLVHYLPNSHLETFEELREWMIKG